MSTESGVTKAPPRNGSYEGVSGIFRGVAGGLRLLRHPRALCFPEGVVDVGRIAPPRRLGIFECGCLRCLRGLDFGKGGCDEDSSSGLLLAVGIPLFVGVGV